MGNCYVAPKSWLLVLKIGKELLIMIQWMSQFSQVQQALIATLLTLGVTALGASLVFFSKQLTKMY